MCGEVGDLGEEKVGREGMVFGGEASSGDVGSGISGGAIRRVCNCNSCDGRGGDSVGMCEGNEVVSTFGLFNDHTPAWSADDFRRAWGDVGVGDPADCACAVVVEGISAPRGTPSRSALLGD